jgi:hypothetical protein
MRTIAIASSRWIVEGKGVAASGVAIGPPESARLQPTRIASAMRQLRKTPRRFRDVARNFASRILRQAPSAPVQDFTTQARRDYVRHFLRTLSVTISSATDTSSQVPPFLGFALRRLRPAKPRPATAASTGHALNREPVH